MTPLDTVQQLIEDHHVSAREAASQVVANMTRDELEADRIAALTRQAVAALRKAAYEATTTPEQLVLFEMARSVPRIIRVEIDDEERFLSWQVATPAQISAHYDWVWAELQRKTGIIERGRGHWALYEGPDDEAIGAQLFKDLPCAICHLPWRPEDLYERAHDTPVGDGTRDQAMRWAHRSCNRSEGTGGSRHEAA